MKSIVTSVGVIVFVAALVAGGTGAFFSDTETSTGNNFTAGAIDLKVDSVAHVNGLVCFDGEWVPENLVEWNGLANQLELKDGVDEDDITLAKTTYNQNFPSNNPMAGDACEGTWTLTDLGPSHTFFNYGDLKPGDEGENTISLHVYNNDAYMCAAIHNVESNDNGLTEPEGDAGDTTPGDGEGELDSELNFFVWEDDGDNIYEGGEDGDDGEILVPPTSGGNVAGVYPLYTPATGGPISAVETEFLGVYWCYGTIGLVDDALTCSGVANGNIGQTDSLTADITFIIEQARHNEEFVCPTLRDIEPDPTKVIVTSDDLAETLEELIAGPTKWLFHNDSNNAAFVMSTNQFASTGGANEIVAGPAGVGAARMVLDNGTDPLYIGGNIGKPRYNIATYKYKDVKLADIGSLEYRIYDASASAQTPYLHFNVDFNNSDLWQSRLVQVPTGVSEDTWTTVDALAGTWTYSGANWPVGVNTLVPFPGTTGRTWADIVADYPNAETRSTDSFFGVRVGHPGPIGEESYVDWVEFDGEVTDFE